MKKHFLLFALLGFALAGPGLAQVPRVVYREIVEDDTTFFKDLRAEDKLVLVAWINSPEAKRLTLLHEATDRRISLARWNWLQNIVAQGNLNEITLNRTLDELRGQTNSDPTNPLNNLLFPRYNFGVQLPLDIFNRQRNTVQLARNEQAVAAENLNIYKRELRVQVLTLYQNYLAQRRLLQAQNEAVIDAETQLQGITDQFRKGEREVADLNEAKVNLNNAKLRVITAERDLQVARIELEGLLGVGLERVLGKQ
jgi:outer membrane protein TolC